MITVDNQVKAGQCGIIDILIDSMKKYTDNNWVCEWGCGTFNNIMVHRKFNVMKKILIIAAADNQAKGGTSGAIDVILSSIKTHIDNPAICKQGCGALWNITTNGKNQIHSRIILAAQL